MASRDARVQRLEKEAGHLAERVLDRERRLRSAMAQLEQTEKLRSVKSEATFAREPAARPGMLARSVRMAERLAESARLGDLLEAAGLLPPKEHERPKPRPAPKPAQPKPAAGKPVAEIEDGVFEGEIEVEIGPLADFAQLTGFEDAAKAIGGAGKINVKRFSGGRATLSVDLEEPVDLLRELEQNAPLGFKVRSLNKDRVVLDVEEDSAAAA
ncbi:MAG: hypothetical protein QOD60_1569 [Solirubrobacterales bacterium]|nr:hypothetical protein [Solirubrobacterales bacterium]